MVMEAASERRRQGRMTIAASASRFRQAGPVRTAVAVAVVLPWLVWAVVRVLGLDGGPLVVPAISFTPYVAATAWIPVLVALLLRQWAVAAVALVPAIALVAVVAPRALGGPDEAIAGGRPLTVLTANLRYGNADPDAVVALARRSGADLVSLQELPPAELEAIDAAGARELYPHRVVDTAGEVQGSALLSRHPLTDAVRPRDLRNAMPEATLHVPGAAAVRVKAVHPQTPLHGDGSFWAHSLRSLPRATPDGELRMLAGDFNATLDHHLLRDLIGSGYTDAGDAAGIGLRGTYPSNRLLRITIDHVLVDERARVTSASVHTIPGSDHRALVARISLPQTANR
jgi:endonuclease/exonuclease/phosphatase (EEP) superfamily protein YafD